MQHRISILLPLVVCLALILAACGGAPATGTTTEAPRTPASTAGNRSVPTNPRSRPPTAPNTDSAQTDTETESYAEASAAAAGGAPPNAPEADAAGGQLPEPRQAHPGDPRRDPPPDKRDRNEPPYDSTYFKNYGVNPFFDTRDDPLSTFAMDIDTASYGVMRRFLSDGALPDPDSVRVEEYLNNFNYRYPQPDDGSTFSIYTESAPSPFGGPAYEIVQIGIQGRTIEEADRAPTSLTFVIDVSGSMAQENRLETVKQALIMLVDQMREDDKIGIVVYGDTAESVLPPTSGANKRRIIDAIQRLEPGGSTNVEAGLDIGFAQADEAFVRGSNQILLCSDGVANNGVTDPQALLAKYERYTSKGIKLSTFGFGMGNYNDILMESLADAGNGFYTYIDTLDEARKVFVDNLVGTLQLIARDAKIQVEFNPDVVQRYRLVGYENRDIADQDFRNDTVDAGEVGAGHSVTALYEIKRYPNAEGAIATVRIRYAKPNNTTVIEEQQAVRTSDGRRVFEDATPRFRLAVSVAEYAELLRFNRWTRGSLLDDVVDLARNAAYDFEGDPDIAEFVQLLNQAATLAPSE